MIYSQLRRNKLRIFAPIIEGVRNFCQTMFEMPDPPKRVTLQLADSIIDCPSHGTSMNLPIAALRRLDAMAMKARFARVSRNELLAALIAAAPLDGARLEEIVREYRQLRIADVLPETSSGDSVVVPIRKPGRPGAQSG
jgi:hypothetical protein